jgi:hypothetical protein
MARTGTLPGVEEATDAMLTEAAEEYVSARDDRMALLKKEVDLKETLIGMMRARRIKTYHDDEANLSIVLESKTSLKVKIGSDDEGEDE